MNIFSKFIKGLKNTKNAIASKLSSLFRGELDNEFYEELEAVLISSDISYNACQKIIENIKNQAKKQKVKTESEFKQLLKNAMIDILTIDDNDEKSDAPVAITVVGVNGVGKTTAIGKLAHAFKNQGKKVLMVAGDTFRAAAADQLTEWSKVSKTRIVKYSEGADPAAVVYDGIKSATAQNDDVVLIDTAGRLQNKVNLMEELKKISRIIKKEWQGDVKNYIVLDATTGQNALSQVEIFNDIIGIDGIILTKLDGTAKGGVVLSIVEQYNIPIKYIGVGERVDDLEIFNATLFVDSIIN